jgi:hypothetical protein
MSDLAEAKVCQGTTEEEVREADDIIAGKPYLLQCIFGCHDFSELTQVWRTSENFTNLAHITARAYQFYQGSHDPTHE